MKIFKIYSVKLILLFFLLNSFTACNQLSGGMQRKKFEFLYKLSNYTALTREYTSSINYYNDLDFYENRMKKIYEDVNNMQTVNGWGTSRVLKEKFLSVIDANLQSANTFRMRMMPSGENIKKEFDIILMNERIDKFNEELDTEISKAGKE